MYNLQWDIVSVHVLFLFYLMKVFRCYALFQEAEETRFSNLNCTLFYVYQYKKSKEKIRFLFEVMWGLLIRFCFTLLNIEINAYANWIYSAKYAIF